MVLHRFYIMTSSHPEATGLKYIGRTAGTLEQRLKGHLNHARYDKNRNGALQQALRKLGDGTFRIDLLEEIDTDDQLEVDHKELELIVRHDAIRRGWNRYTSFPVRRKNYIPSEGGILERWRKIKELSPWIEEALFKNNQQSLVQARHGLRQLRTELHALTRLMIQTDRHRKA